MTVCRDNDCVVASWSAGYNVSIALHREPIEQTKLRRQPTTEARIPIPTVIQPLLRGTTLSYDFILLKGYADPITPIIIDTDAEVRWVGTPGVGAQNCMLFDNAFYLTSGASLLRT